MKKVIIPLIWIFSTFAAHAQTVPFGNTRYKGEFVGQRIFQDCERNIYSINDLMADKPLIMFQSTVDCGYCFEEAPAVSDDIIKYKDKINFAFFLTSHNTYPRCSSKDAGDHDWPDDWRNRYPGYKNIPISIQGIDYFMLNCEVTTSFGVLDPRTNKIVGGGCREDGSKSAIEAALKLIADGVYTSFATSVVKPQIAVSPLSNKSTITLTTATSGAEIYYTTDGSTPSKSSKKYTSSFEVTDSRLVKAIAVKANMNMSPVAIKFIEVDNASLVNIAPTGTAYQWTGLPNYTSNSNRKVFAAANDGKMVNASLNNGQADAKNTYEAVGVVWDEEKTGITSLKLTHVSVLSRNDNRKNFFGFGMKVQTTNDGQTWTDLNIANFPEYPYGAEQFSMNTDPILFFGDNPITAKGIRIIGQLAISGVNWANTGDYLGLRELEIFKNNNVTNTEDFYSNQEINIYPNPAKDMLHASFADPSYTEYTISDLTGKVLIASKIVQKDNDIDVSMLPKGLYVFKAIGAKTHIQKMLLQ